MPRFGEAARYLHRQRFRSHAAQILLQQPELFLVELFLAFQKCFIHFHFFLRLCLPAALRAYTHTQWVASDKCVRARLGIDTPTHARTHMQAPVYASLRLGERYLFSSSSSSTRLPRFDC